MNNYSSLRKQNNGKTQAAVISLLLCVLLTTTLLVSRLVAFSPRDTRHYIPLTRSSGTTHVDVGQRQEDGSIVYDTLGVQPVGRRLLAANPGFRVYDENTVWSGTTDVEIFSITYDNDTGETTVRSQNGTKVLAPGTGNTYEFTLENTGNVPLEYTMEMEAWFSHGEYPIPIVASVCGYDGDWLLGGESEMVDVLRLSEVDEKGTIDAGYLQPYTLRWEWPFEKDDAYDTMLGNMAVEQDITLTIEIRTTACYTDDDDPDGVPETGDRNDLTLYAVLLTASLAGLMLLLIMARKEREKQYE